MMARFSLLSTTLAAALAFGAISPALAQSAPPPPPPHPAAQPMIKLDFGMGRKVAIDCGDQTLAACIETAKPLIDQVANSPIPQPRPNGPKGDHKGEHKGDHKEEGPKPPKP